MNLQSVRSEIGELRNSLLYQYEPTCKAFILGAKDSPTEAEVEDYRKDHPHTKVVVLTRKDCGGGSTD